MKILMSLPIILSLGFSLACQRDNKKSDDTSHEVDARFGFGNGNQVPKAPLPNTLVETIDDHEHAIEIPLVTGEIPSPSANLPLIPFRMVSALDGSCAVAEENSDENRALLRTAPCQAIEAHQWSLLDSETSVPSFKLSNLQSQKCMDVLNVSQDEGARVGQYTCVFPAGCQDTFVVDSPNKNGAVNFAFTHSGKCLEIREGRVVQATCDGSLKQDWFLH